MDCLMSLVLEKYRMQFADKQLQQLEEIRMRVGHPLALSYGGREELYWPRVTVRDLKETVAAACRQSVYAHTETIRQGYITVEGGHRVGLCGFGVVTDGYVKNISDISSLVIRIARQVIGCADRIFPAITSSTLIIGPPGSGKTTLLRDVVRQLSGQRKVRVGLADERGEISAGSFGVPQLDVGPRTDVLINIPKAEASMMLLRTMGPQWIAMDEVTQSKDIQAIEQISYCGVSVLATAHAHEPEDLMKRSLYRKMMQSGVFDKIVILHPDRTQSVQEAK